MKTITQAELQRLRLKLESCREEALGVLDRLDGEMRGLDMVSPMDSGDRSVSHLVRESLYLQGSQCRSWLCSIAAALDRMGEGTYGRCAVCGLEIQPRRLEAVPWADCCLGCQQRMEQQLESEASSPIHEWHGGRTA